jgi:hypothetical protein
MPKDAEPSERAPWIEPVLTEHDTLLSLTRQQRHPITGRPLDPSNPYDRAILAQIPGSQGFFP